MLTKSCVLVAVSVVEAQLMQFPQSVRSAQAWYLSKTSTAVS